jgi:sec-independent protein translocase protein TatA
MSFGIKELIVILVIVMLVFGTKKIKGVGSDVGGWIRDFKKALKDGEDEVADTDVGTNNRVIDADAIPVTEKEKV